jgi:hypothetical protein
VCWIELAALVDPPKDLTSAIGRLTQRQREPFKLVRQQTW